MSKIKSLILGSAAGLVAIAGAQAADLPVKAKAVEYVKVCSLYGAGFFYIPGTDTCIKFGGYLRADFNYHGGTYDAPFYNLPNGANTRDVNQLNVRSRLAFTVDTRTATEYGVVRTFAQTDWQFSTFGGNGLDTPGGGYVAVENAFVQFAGFTFGKSASAYASPWHGYPGNNTSFLLGGHDSVTGVNNIHYDWIFGNGLSASLGVDEQIVFDRTALGNFGVLGSAAAINAQGLGVTNSYGGQNAPDIVGNIKLDQAWGLIQVSGAAHNLNASYYTIGGLNTELNGHPDDEWGFAVMGALQLKNLPTGPGDDIKFDVSYADGATKYVIATSGPSPSFGMYNGSTFGFGYTSDGLFATGGGIEKTKAWGLRGAFNHNWNAYWQSNLFGSYSQVSYNDNAKNIYCSAYGAAVAGRGATYSCDPNFTIAQIGFRTGWTPVKNLTLSAEVQYVMLDTGFNGSAALPAIGAKAPGVYNFGDVGNTSVNFRVQRNF